MDLLEEKKDTRQKAVLTPALMHAALTDKYKENLTADLICKKHNISANTWRAIDKEHGKTFVAKFGANKKKVVLPEMETFWAAYG